MNTNQMIKSMIYQDSMDYKIHNISLPRTNDKSILNNLHFEIIKDIYLYLRLFTMKTKTLFDHIKQITNVQNQFIGTTLQMQTKKLGPIIWCIDFYQ